MQDLPRKRSRKGSGVYQTGKERLLQIQAVALGILVEEGFPALTLREVARRCNIQIGAVSYYYKSRVDLFQDTISNVLKDYAENFRSIVQDKSKSDEDRLHSLIELLLDDMQSKQTTRLFPHLWMLANHDDLIAQTVDRIYILERNTLNMLIARINPKLSKQERETLSVFLSASIAGSTLFVGFEKPWARELWLLTVTILRVLARRGGRQQCCRTTSTRPCSPMTSLIWTTLMRPVAPLEDSLHRGSEVILKLGASPADNDQRNTSKNCHRNQHQSE
jgi:AcrR family transcriptional regulator